MFRALKALFASLIAGLLVVQLFATAGRSDETMIAAYIFVPVIAGVALVTFLVAGLGAAGRDRVHRLGLLAIVGIAVLGAIMVSYEAWKIGVAALMQQATLYLALVLGPLATVATQWLILRRPDQTEQ